MDVVDAIREGTPMGARTWLVRPYDESRLLKLFPLQQFNHRGESLDDPFEISMPRVNGVAHWHDFRFLDAQDCEALDLAMAGAVVAMRPFLDGVELSAVPERAAEMWHHWALRLAFSLRGLAAQKCPHGNLRRRHVIITDGNHPWIVGLPLVSDDTAGGAPHAEGRDAAQLAELICWMASAGESNAPVQAIPEGLPQQVASLVERALSQPAEQRPAMGDFITALKGAVADVQPPFLALPPSLYRGLERRVVDRIAGGEQVVFLKGEAATGKSYALERIASRLRLNGRRVVCCSTGSPRMSDEPVLRASAPNSPWDGLRRCIAALATDSESPALRFSTTDDVTGDHRYVLERWTQRLKQVLPSGNTIVLWDDFDALGPDVQAFWRYFMSSLSGDRTRSIQLVATVESDDGWQDCAISIPVAGPADTAWDGWRARTRFAEVREIPAMRWKTLVAEKGTKPVALLEAISRAIDADERPQFAMPRFLKPSSPDVSVLFASDWKRYLEGLFASGAYLELAETCRRLYSVLSRSGRAERVGILEIWTEAIIRYGVEGSRLDALDAALCQTAQPVGVGADALLLRARLLWERDQYQQALDVLDELGDVEAHRASERRRWRAQILLSLGQFESAQAVAEAGIAELDEGMDEARAHLESVALGAKAMNRDSEVIADLRRFAVSSDATYLQPRLRADCHVYRAVAATRLEKFADATDAYLRAVEEMETAGFYARLPTYLLDLGTSYRRQGCLGIAHEYYAWGSRLINDATPPATGALLLVHEANIDVVLRRFEYAAPKIERALALVHEHNLAPVRPYCARLAGAVACAENDPDRALRIYDEVARESPISPRQRVQLLLASAGAALQNRQLRSVSQCLDEGRRLIEHQNIDDLRLHYGILRARAQLADNDRLAKMTGVERFRRHLLEAAQADDHALVLRQGYHLWSWLKEDQDVAASREIAQVYRNAVQAVSVGLSKARRDELLAHLPELGDGDEDNNHQLSSLRKANEALKRQLAQRDVEREEMARRVATLEAKLQAATSGSSPNKAPSRRGRRPKARRDDVVEALQRFDGDFAGVAEALGVSERTVYRYIRRYDLQEWR